MTTNKNLRPHRVGFRLNEVEYEKLKSDFKEFGYKRMSEFARFKLLLDIKFNDEVSLVATDLKTELKEFNFQVNKVGNNINQVTKALHSNNVSHQMAIEELTSQMKYIYKLAIALNRHVNSD